MVLLDDGRHRARGTDAVAPHHERLLLSVLVEIHRAERLGEERPQLEDVAEFDRSLRDQLAAALSTAVARIRLPDVFKARLVVTAGLHSTQMPAVAIRSCDELAHLQRLVRNHLDVDSHRPERAAPGAERLADLVLGRRPEGTLQGRRELLLAEPVVAAHQRQHDAVSHDDGHRLRGCRRIDLQELGEPFDGRDARRLDFLGRCKRLRELGGARDSFRRFDVCGVVAVLATHELVVAGFRGRKIVPGHLAAHDPGLRLDLVDLEPAALEDLLVGLRMELEALVQPFGVSIERIRVLHDELAHSQEPGARPRLVALLCAEVVPALRELFVRLDLPGVEGHRLFV